MSYTNEDARFDAEQQGRCPLCRSAQCDHCEECGKRGCFGSCLEMNDEGECA